MSLGWLKFCVVDCGCRSEETEPHRWPRLSKHCHGTSFVLSVIRVVSHGNVFEVIDSFLFVSPSGKKSSNSMHAMLSHLVQSQLFRAVSFLYFVAQRNIFSLHSSNHTLSSRLSRSMTERTTVRRTKHQIFFLLLFSLQSIQTDQLPDFE